MRRRLQRTTSKNAVRVHLGIGHHISKVPQRTSKSGRSKSGS
jgi:hypothetical protein